MPTSLKLIHRIDEVQYLTTVEFLKKLRKKACLPVQFIINKLVSTGGKKRLVPIYLYKQDEVQNLFYKCRRLSHSSSSDIIFYNKEAFATMAFIDFNPPPPTFYKLSLHNA